RYRDDHLDHHFMGRNRAGVLRRDSVHDHRRGARCTTRPGQAAAAQEGVRAKGGSPRTRTSIITPTRYVMSLPDAPNLEWLRKPSKQWVHEVGEDKTDARACAEQS